ncbi:hypothetical protein TNCT_63921 [Trichonephila clavata]|uniref:Uncharacterized protein n=1 Tax=Trichonephila clavata TaxID=2740835 RepID=A0A8X6FI88_TRICU|nr:hypothetical protein TNCT_63921 [Trichonephila clavata]
MVENFCCTLLLEISNQHQKDEENDIELSHDTHTPAQNHGTSLHLHRTTNIDGMSLSLSLEFNPKKDSRTAYKRYP